jgi:pyruvate dehydrogenase (quinone)
MGQTVSEFVIRRMQEWGVSRVYGYPGDGIGEFDGVLGKTDREGTGLEYIRPTHEEMSAFMATAHAKFTGEVGVCIATSSPGAFHLLNGLYDAKSDNVPVVAIVGQQGLASLGTFTQQEDNLERAFADVACYVQTILTPENAQAVVDTAFRTAIARLQPAVVVFPHDVQAMDAGALGAEHWVSRSSAVAASTRITPPEDELRRAAEIINAGERVTFLVGAGARGATDEVLAAAERVGAGIITALRGKEVVPSDVPYHSQQVGLLGSLPSLHQMNDCDTVVMLGTNYPYGEFLPKTGQARGVQVDLKPEQLGVRYPTEVNLWGDVRSTLTALLPMLEQTSDTSWQEKVAREFHDWEQEMERQAMVTFPDGGNPRRIFHELNKRLPHGAIVTCDAGTTADWYGHHIRLRRGMKGDLSGRLASMNGAMPYAVAAKFAYSDRTVICTIGDGAFQMLGMNELITVKKYLRSWDDPTFIVIVMHNDDLAQVSWEMRTEDGNPVWRASQDVESVDYAGWTRLLGFNGITVTKDEDAAAAVEAALGHRGVTVIDDHVTRNAPPLPPKITKEYRNNTIKSFAKGDPLAPQVLIDSAEGLVTEGVERVKGALHLGSKEG